MRVKPTMHVFMPFADNDTDPRQCTPDTPGICHPNATCNQITRHMCACNPASSYRCECNQGYIGDGLTCTSELQLAVNVVTVYDDIHSFIHLFAQ